jgi:4-amino-4-deoxy-L-arabinose transferase-like glycosyltransferase
LGVVRPLAFYTSLVLMFNPFFVSLSFSFMTEVYFLFFFMLSLYLRDQVSACEK